MKKNELNARYQEMIQRRKEDIRQCRERGSDAAASRLYGEICGIAAAMRASGFIDYDQEAWIRDDAKKVLDGKEDHDEAC